MLDPKNLKKKFYHHPFLHFFLAVALVRKDIVFRSIIEYSSLRDFGP
jgi:hypothetical protein